MKCDDCGHEFESPVIRTDCPDCGAQLDVNVNYKSPVQHEDDTDE